jgi:hypothetical protein
MYLGSEQIEQEVVAAVTGFVSKVFLCPSPKYCYMIILKTEITDYDFQTERNCNMEL